MKEQIEVFKALSDKNRLLIIEMLSCGDLCACDLVRGLELTQPTISHHMKILQRVGLIYVKRDGKWMVYSLNYEKFDQLCDFIKNLSSEKEYCICKKVSKSSCCEEVK